MPKSSKNFLHILQRTGSISRMVGRHHDKLLHCIAAGAATVAFAYFLPHNLRDGSNTWATAADASLPGRSCSQIPVPPQNLHSSNTVATSPQYVVPSNSRPPPLLLLQKRLATESKESSFSFLATIVGTLISKQNPNWSLVSASKNDFNLQEMKMSVTYVNDGNPLMDSFKNRQGLELRTYLWLPKFKDFSTYDSPLASKPRLNFLLSYIEKFNVIREIIGNSLRFENRLFSTFYRPNATDIDKTGSFGSSICKDISGNNLKGIVILVHGFREHCRGQFLAKPPPENYKLRNPAIDNYPSNEVLPVETDTFSEITYENSWIEKLNKAGYAVAGLDIQGHGLSEAWSNLRCTVKDVDDMAKDTLLFAKILQSKVLELMGGANTSPPPMYLLGISMGGWVCARAVQLCDGFNAEIKSLHSRTLKTPVPITEVSTFSLHRLAALATNFANKLVAGSSSSPKNFLSPHVYEKVLNNKNPLILEGVILVSPMLQLERQKKKMQWDILKYFLVPFAALYPTLHFNNDRTGSYQSAPHESREVSSFSVAGNIVSRNSQNKSREGTAVAKPAKKIHQRAGRFAYPFLEYYYRKDPLAYKGGIPLKMLVELMSAPDIIHEANQVVKMKTKNCKSILVIHSALDPICDFNGSLNFFNGISKIEDKHFLALNALSISASRKTTSGRGGGSNDDTPSDEKGKAQHTLITTNNDGSIQGDTLKNFYKSRSKYALCQHVDVWHNFANEPASHTVFCFILEWLKSKR